MELLWFRRPILSVVLMRRQQQTISSVHKSIHLFQSLGKKEWKKPIATTKKPKKMLSLNNNIAINTVCCEHCDSYALDEIKSSSFNLENWLLLLLYEYLVVRVLTTDEVFNLFMSF